MITTWESKPAASQQIRAGAFSRHLPQINYKYVNKVVKAAIHLLMVNMNGVYLVFLYLGIGTYYPVNIQSTIITHFPH